MRLPGRRPAPRAVHRPVVPDAAEQAAWDADRPPLHPRRKAILALGLAALLVVAVLVVARSRGDGDILALGSSPKSSSTLPPVTDLDPITGDPLFEGSQLITPGDPSAPGAAAAGAQPGAAGAADPAAAGAGAGQAGGGGGATPGDQSGGVAGGGVPTPTTPPGSGDGGTTPTTQAGGGTPATTTIVPGQAPPPPSCSVTDASVDPTRLGLKGNSGKLDSNLKVQFRATSACGSGFRVQVNGQDVPAGAGPGGLLIATISGDTANWVRGPYSISVKNSGGTLIATISLTVI